MGNRCRMGLLALIIAAFCTGCGQQQTAEKVKRDFTAEAEAVYASCVSSDDCFLCRGMSEYEGQNNVGIISLNTFQLMPVEINRYERGQLIEENTGSTLVMFHTGEDDGFSASLFLHIDRGRATASVSFNEDETLDFANTDRHLCGEHLSELVDGLYRNAYGVGIINFDTKRLEPLCDGTLGFESGDYYSEGGWPRSRLAYRLYSATIRKQQIMKVLNASHRETHLIACYIGSSLFIRS